MMYRENISKLCIQYKLESTITIKQSSIVEPLTHI